MTDRRPLPASDFTYSNSSGRPPGPVLSAAARLLRGVREVQAQVEPYARAWEAHNRRAVAATGPLWVALGDSMAQGIGASAYDGGWVGQLVPRVDDVVPGHRLVNLSVSGGRVDDVLERQLPTMAELAPDGPALVTIIIGSNDLMGSTHRRLLPDRLAELLRRLPVGTVMASLPGNRPAARAFNRQLDDAARRRGLVVADFRTRLVTSWKGKLAADHFHPNDLGYAGMAEVMARAVDRAIDAR